jgi:hypothetical protein
MSEQTVSIDYANTLIYELQKAFWDERGNGARFRTTKVGYQYYIDRIKPLLDSPEVDEILKKIQGVLQGEGNVEDISYDRDERLLKVSVKGCLHRPVEERMLAKEIEPFTCIPANLIVLAIEEKLDIPVELAEIKLETGACKLLLVLFEKRPELV